MTADLIEITAADPAFAEYAAAMQRDANSDPEFVRAMKAIVRREIQQIVRDSMYWPIPKKLKMWENQYDASGLLRQD